MTMNFYNDFIATDSCHAILASSPVALAVLVMSTEQFRSAPAFSAAGTLRLLHWNLHAQISRLHDLDPH
jgi:hypothetical protein